MATIRLKHLELGALLSDDVKDINGRMLLKAGSEITEKHLKILKTWGVTEVAIVGEDPPENEIEIELSEVAPELMKQVEQSIDKYFILCNKEHPVNRELRGYMIIKKVKEHLSSGNIPV